MGDVCLYPDETPVEDGKGHVIKMWRILLVIRDRPGYSPSKYGPFASEKEAWKKAMDLNMDMGVYTRAQVYEIVGSSIRAQDEKDGTDLLGRGA